MTLEDMIAQYYSKDGNGTGGNLHVVLDDGNVNDLHIDFCRNQCALNGDVDGLAILDVIAAMPEKDRRAAIGFDYTELDT